MSEKTLKEIFGAERDKSKFLPRNNERSNDLASYVFQKVPPQAVPVEEAVLGALLTDKDALTSVMDILRPESFYLDAHQLIYKAILRLFEKSQPIDLLTVKEALLKSGDLERVGNAVYLADLTNRVGSAANIEYHARIIAQKHIQRELIRISTKTIKDAFEDSTDVFQLLDNAEQGLFDITQNNLNRSYEQMGSIATQLLKQIEEISKREDGLTGIPTGFTGLDRLTSGWQRSDLVIIAARPSMGKCLGKGTKVLLLDGNLKNVEDIIVGDLLMGDDNTPRRVLSLARGQENMYWVRQNKGIDYRVNESHILSLKRSRNEGKYQHGDVLDICLRDYLATSQKFKTNYKGYKVAVEFSEKSVSLHPYFLGIWLGDGRTSDSRIATQDKEVVDFLGEYAKELSLSLHEYTQPNRVNRYAITGGYGSEKATSIKATLRNIKVLNCKHIPENYLLNSTENRLQLLAGLLDSDGHYLMESNGFEITQKNENLARQIKFLCDSLGFRTSLIPKKATISSIGYECEVYRVRIFGNVDCIPTRIERKKARVLHTNRDWQVTGIAIEFDKFDDYYGFEIDGNRRFLLEDMTVTHNTALTLNLARNAAIDFKKPIAIFSLEMSNLQLVQRLISMESEIAADKLRNGKLEDYEWQQLQSTIERMSEVPIFVDDTPALNIFELRAKCRRLKQQHGIELIIIDYLQLMSGGSETKGNREQEIGSISRALKGMAKELNVPVIALSQLSRAVEVRGGAKRPQLSDLRESGSIEQDADIVAFIYRPEYYQIMEDEQGQSLKGVTEFIIAKHRNGALDTIKLRFRNEIGRFTDFEDADLDNYLSGNGSPLAGDFSKTPNPNDVSIMTRPSKMNDEDIPF
jgi:replicative DNA helicase